MVICQSIIHAKVVPRQSVQITFICQSGFTPKLLLRQTVHVKLFHAKVFYAKMSVSRLVSCSTDFEYKLKSSIASDSLKHLLYKILLLCCRLEQLGLEPPLQASAKIRDISSVRVCPLLFL